jgi:hypothetical protein
MGEIEPTGLQCRDAAFIIPLAPVSVSQRFYKMSPPTPPGVRSVGEPLLEGG